MTLRTFVRTAISSSYSFHQKPPWQVVTTWGRTSNCMIEKGSSTETESSELGLSICPLLTSHPTHMPSLHLSPCPCNISFQYISSCLGARLRVFSYPSVLERATQRSVSHLIERFKAGPSSNRGSPPQGGFSYWANKQWKEASANENGCMYCTEYEYNMIMNGCTEKPKLNRKSGISHFYVCPIVLLLPLG
jgi:hypothetical protein